MINTVIQGDCLEVMKRIEDKSVDMIVTSPPYNVGGKSVNKALGSIYNQYKDNLSRNDYSDFLINSSLLMLKKSRYVAFNLQILSGNKQSIWDWIAELRYQIKDVIIWKKQAVAQIQKGKTATGYEYIYMLGNNDKMTFDYNNFPDNNYVPNIQEWTDMSYIKGHHATFPLQVPAFFINYFSKPNDLILDPFAGSGTTLVAAKQLGRRYIGIEISEEYCKIARERLKQEELELK